MLIFHFRVVVIKVKLFLSHYCLCSYCPQKILTSIGEKGPQFTLSEYTQLIQLFHRSHFTADQTVVNDHMRRLHDVIEKGQNE